MIDVYFYCGALDGYQRDLKSIEFEKLKRAAEVAGKPMIVGEFGMFKSQFTDDFDAACQYLQSAWLPALNQDWQGWFYWTYDTHEQPRLWNRRKQYLAHPSPTIRLSGPLDGLQLVRYVWNIISYGSRRTLCPAIVHPR
jgi:hypothetical protein